MARIVGFLPSAAFYVLALAAQVSGYTSTTVALILAAMATVMLLIPACHHGGRWHKARKSSGRGGLDSWYFIVPCLVTALLAAIGGAYGIGLRSSVQVTDQSIPTSSTPPAPADVPVTLAKNYFPDEKQKLGSLFTAIRERLNGDGKRAGAQGARYGGDILQSKDQIISLVGQVEATRGLLGGIRRYVYDELIPNNPSYNLELTQLVSNGPDSTPLGRFDRELELFHRELTVLRDRYDKIDEETRVIDAYLINRTTPPLREIANAFTSWVQQCNDRIDAQRELLR
jgi:hypothetical protein